MHQEGNKVQHTDKYLQDVHVPLTIAVTYIFHILSDKCNIIWEHNLKSNNNHHQTDGERKVSRKLLV